MKLQKARDFYHKLITLFSDYDKITFMNVLILQPPILQSNTVYPSGAYLSAFFKNLGHTTKWIDLNILLFDEIFSSRGLKKLFDLASQNALKIAEKAEQSGDDATAFNLRRYVSEKKLWISWIDRIMAILRGKGFENAHRFCFGAHVPRGSRMENYLSNLDHDLTTDDARTLASFALADLADFITIAFDKNFSLVRYAESLTISESSFTEIEKGADSPVLKHFYGQILERLFLNDDFYSAVIEPVEMTKKCGFDKLNHHEKSHNKNVILNECEESLKQMFRSAQHDNPTLVLISIPFPGTFAAALATGKFFKNHFGEKVYVSMGGGFVNTELRETKEPALAKYTDALCFDRGYASYKTLLEKLDCHSEKDSRHSELVSESTLPIYKMRQFIKSENKTTVIDEAPATKDDLIFENQMTRALVPDFSDIDFSIYPRMIDDKNPMHRLWTDGAWIKIYMAHGCYWHKCAFCDVTLDYVCAFQPTDVKKLYDGIYKQCVKKNIYGIHFVDEAMPPRLMVEFAKENIAHGSPLTWWGNIRFEKYFTRDVADFLAYGGLIGVSAGLESATGNGLTAIHKGTDLESIVSACCAFKEAGVLVHAYMIYGYWWEKTQDLINSMETLRQFYENGLLDSSFWHKFVLTRHSRVFNEWKQGLIKDLKPILPDENKKSPLFAKNGLHFEGEKSSEKYGHALDFSLDEWMHGRGIEKPVQKWFNFPVPKPTVSKNFIKNLIDKYVANGGAAAKTVQMPFFSETPGSCTTKSLEKHFCHFEQQLRHSELVSESTEISNSKFWLGGEKITLPNGKILWFYMGELYEEKPNANESKFRGKGLCDLG